MRKQTTLWKCKDGTKIRICDMTDGHLVSAIALLDKYAERMLAGAAGGSNPFHGTIAAEMFDDFQEGVFFEGAEDVDPADIFPAYIHLCKEADRRGLERDKIG